MQVHRRSIAIRFVKASHDYVLIHWKFSQTLARTHKMLSRNKGENQFLSIFRKLLFSKATLVHALHQENELKMTYYGFLVKYFFLNLLT